MIGSLTRSNQYATKIAINHETCDNSYATSRESVVRVALKRCNRVELHRLVQARLSRARHVVEPYRNLSLPRMSSSTSDSSTAPTVCSFDSVIKALLMVYSDDHTGEDQARARTSDGLTLFSRVTCSFSWLRRPTASLYGSNTLILTVANGEMPLRCLRANIQHDSLRLGLG